MRAVSVSAARRGRFPRLPAAVATPPMPKGQAFVALAASDLSPLAIKVGVIILDAFNIAEDRAAWPSHEYIAESLVGRRGVRRIHPKSVAAAVRELTEAGFIERYINAHRSGTNEYMPGWRKLKATYTAMEERRKTLRQARRVPAEPMPTPLQGEATHGGMGKQLIPEGE